MMEIVPMWILLARTVKVDKAVECNDTGQVKTLDIKVFFPQLVTIVC